MGQRFTFAALLVMAVTSPVIGQSPSGDEKQIRDLIAREDSGQSLPTTGDRIFWSGAYKRPIVGNQKGEEVAAEGQPAARVPGSQRSKTTVVRIEIAKSGDLAYEFSNSELSFDLKSGQHVSFPRSTLRVWRKEGGQWKTAAYFTRPHEEGPATPSKK